MNAGGAVIEQGLPTIPEHQIVRPIGMGAYGEVWLGLNALGTPRAVKIVKRGNFETQNDFEREYRGLQRFEPVSRLHEALVQVLQIGFQGDWFYYVMELADSARPQGDGLPKIGPERGSAPGWGDEAFRFYLPLTLRQRLKEGGHLASAEVITLGRRIASALSYLHQEGLAHRDVKPSNIIFVKGQPKLADAGLVTAFDDARSLVGTPGYMAPEGPGTAQADIYSLGKVLYEVTFGQNRQAFPHLPIEITQHPERAILLEINEVVGRACEHDLRARYHSAEEIVAEFSSLEAGHSIIAKRRHARRVKSVRNWLLLLVLMAATVWMSVFSFSSSGFRLKKPPISRVKEAADAYVAGRYFYSKNTGEALRKAIGQFERAVQKDPRFAPAYAGLASCYSWEMPGFQTDLAQAKHFAEKALELDPNLAEAHKVLAWLKFNQRDWTGGNREAQRAIELSPDDPEVHSWYSVPLYWMGRTGESIAQLEKAQELDQTSLSIPSLMALAYFMARQDERSIEEINKVMTMETNAPSYAFRTLAEIYEYRKSFLKAIEVRERWEKIAGIWSPMHGDAYSALREAFTQGGEAGYWRKQAEDLTAQGADPYYIARCYAMLGEKELALRWLQSATTNRSMMVSYLLNDRALDGLRGDGRFAAVVRSLNLDHVPR